MHKIKSSYLSRLTLLTFLAISIPLFIGASPLPYIVKNTTQEALGSVVLHHLGGQIEINVSTPGTWVTPISLPISAVTINQQLVIYPLPAYISLPSSGHTARVQWSSPSMIEIIDLQMGS